MKLRRIVVVPRWGGTPQDDWYPWVRRELESPELGVDVLDMPDPGEPRLDTWPARILEEIVAQSTAAPSETLLVGHSVGCQAALRAVAELPEGSEMAGLVCVAGWWSVDEPWETIRPWIETPLDVARVKAATPKIEVLLSTNDPFTASYEENARLWRCEVDAQVVVVPGGRHFNEREEPAVLDLLRRHVAM